VIADFNSDSHIRIFEDFLSDNDGLSRILVSQIFPFDSKDDLLRTMPCIYEFLSAPKNTTRSITKY